MSLLKPCPFCGGPARLRAGRVCEDAEEAFVQCERCFVSTDRLEDAYAPREAAIDLWNRRINPNPEA
ncbi:Lar family restriction alleviation protein [Phenylobacterium sp.]|uniref:Lar family restriction alleviation protein n=1 Tax=Phenylobacterium sp. TaxID=1871053 RepID=UPI00345BE210